LTELLLDVLDVSFVPEVPEVLDVDPYCSFSSSAAALSFSALP